MDERAAWVEIVSEVAHDLKTPLTSARGFVELIVACGDPLTARQQRYADVALEALEHMEHLVARLLEASWIEEGRPLKLCACNLEALILGAVVAMRGAAERSHVTLHVELDTRLGSIQGDERRLEQVVHNLLSNAIKYNHAGGNVWLTASGARDAVEITVRDDGRGIGADDLPHIFERFYRASTASSEKVEGTGLGLAIVKALVEKHGGQVTVESTPGAGTSFVVTLPRTLPVPLHAASEADREPVSPAVAGAESVDTLQADDAREVLDAVDDNLQEPPQLPEDEDDHSVAQQD